jgi:hypothetical protein
MCPLKIRSSNVLSQKFHLENWKSLWQLTLSTVPSGHKKNFRTVCAESNEDLFAGNKEGVVCSHEIGWTEGEQEGSR